MVSLQIVGIIMMLIAAIPMAMANKGKNLKSKRI
jgi:hypothetical protein